MFSHISSTTELILLSSSNLYFTFRFDFVKSIGKNLNQINLPKNTELTSKILLGIVKQDPIYLRPRSSLVSIMFYIESV